MDIFQNQCSESLGFDSMLSSNHLNSPLHDSPGSPNQLTFGPSSPYFSSISQQLCGTGTGGGSTSGPNDVILPSIFVKIPTQINQQYQQENRLRNARNPSEIKCEERAEPIKSELADTRLKLPSSTAISDQLPDLIDNYLNDTPRAAANNGVVGAEEYSIHRCDHCPFATLSEPALAEHKQTKHTAGGRMLLDTLSCPVCENKFYKKTVLELHLLDDHEMARSEVELLCGRIANLQQSPGGGQSVVACSLTQTSSTQTQTISATPAPNKSRIYIKDVQLLKKPDVIAQETQNGTHVQQTPVQQMLPMDQQQQSAQDNLLSATEASSHEQYQSEQHQPTAHGVGSGSKIFIRNVSLLQNVNFTPTAENLLSNGGKYHSFLNHECQSSLSSSSPAIDTSSSSIDDSYCQMLPSTVATQPRSNRIYIKNVDILRNPLLSLDHTASTVASNSYSAPTTSRASSCESIICTSTPPPLPPPPPTPQSANSSQNPLPPIVPPTAATIIPLSQLTESQLAPGNEQSLTGAGMDQGDGGNMLGLMAPQSQQQSQSIGQGAIGLPMMYTTVSEPTRIPTDSCPSSCISIAPVNSPSTSNAQSNPPGNNAGYQLATFTSDGEHPQQEPRKSKIFIKNISVLKQPTIHLKSVDEVNLMTYDQLQLQNLLPVGVNAPVGCIMSMDQTGVMDNDGEAMEQSFGQLMDAVVEQQPTHEEAMDGYQDDVGCYDDLDVCDFSNGFNERDDPGGGEGAISVPSGGSNNNTLSMSCDGLLGETRCDNFQSGFDQDIILLQPPNSGGGDSQPNEAQKMSECWPPVVGGGSLLSQETSAASESVPGEGTVVEPRNEEGEQQQDKDILFICAQEVINLDPPVEEPKVSEVDGGAHVDNSAAELLSTAPNDGQKSERPRPRGRPRGAKQTGITKLKKLYSNLTPQEEGYKCDIKECGARFRQPDRLEYHRKCHLPGTTGGGESGGIRCPECGSLEFRNWNTLHTHLWREHAIDMELYACQLCSFKTPVLCRLTNTHMKIHSEERNFKCAICSKAFKNNKQLRNHRRSHRDPVQQAQTHQQQNTSPEEVASTDMMVVENTAPAESASSKSTSKPSTKPPAVPIKCVKCGQKFTNQRQLHSHMDAKHPPAASDGAVSSEPSGKHRCAMCGMMFKTRYLLQSHSAKHSDEKRFKCEHCDYATNDHNAFRRHKMRHNAKGNHMYKCSYCDYTSIQSTTYRKHLERMHADEASRLLYKCAKCPFVSISELKYQLHRAKHEQPENGEESPAEDAQKNTEHEQLPLEGNVPPMAEDVVGSGQEQPQEDDSRACESVGSDVMIVDNREPAELNHSSYGQLQVQHPDVSGLQLVQQPIIRPAMFANNFSKVDNFYGHHSNHGQLQPKILKLTDRIPSHRVSPLGQLPLLQPLSVQSSLVTLPGTVGASVSFAVSSQDLATVDFQMDSYDMQQHQQQQQEHQQYEHHQQQMMVNAVGDTIVLGRN
ncbi:AGAP007129-PA-like protein [Anopheles sinensis]|uniref:AGAP007129-PA-like protein n=1 Tax=Anopheles sinensis TaxID=74873 RepID=A0A084WK80_ANOSI|nr:AGAP007129-PA-like protein [Anopheles sinensis]